MSLSYTLNESLSGFKRTKLSSIVSIITICIALILLGIFAILTVNATRFVDVLRSKVELEAFLREPIEDATVDSLLQVVLAMDGIESVTFVSKTDAARVFKEEFGEDITQVLDFNPLPPSFKIGLRPEYKTAEGAQRVNDGLVALKEVESVAYRKSLIELIDRRTRTINSIMLGLGVFLGLSAIVLVSNTIRLAIHAKRKLIRTMALVGATSGFIRMPFVLEGILQGLIGGLLASGILFGFLEYAIPFVSADLQQFIHMEPMFYLLMVGVGMALGFVGSIISVLRFIDAG